MVTLTCSIAMMATTTGKIFGLNGTRKNAVRLRAEAALKKSRSSTRWFMCQCSTVLTITMCLCRCLPHPTSSTRTVMSICLRKSSMSTPHHEFHYDCHEGYSNWFFGWSAHKKSWCCDHMTMGCPGTWHGSYHIHTHVFAKGVGHAHGRIYDCNAGFSNWMQGWSGSKKDWCCSKHNKGCVKFHCSSGAVP